MKNHSKTIEQELVGNLKNDFIYYFSLVGIVSIFFFSFYSFFIGKTTGALFELVCGVVTVANLIFFKLHRRYEVTSVMILMILYALLCFLFLDGGLFGTGSYWFFTFPVLAYFLRGKREGTRWTIIFAFSILFLQYLRVSLNINSIYSWFEVRQLLSSFAAVSFLVFFYELIVERTIDALNEKTLELKMRNNVQSQIVKEKEEAQEGIEQNLEELKKAKLAMLNILEDLDKEKRESEKFQLAVENASDQIVITDKQGTILYANPSTERITGYSVEELIGKKAGGKELWGGQESADFYQKMWKRISKEKKNYSDTIKNKHKSGREYYAQISISPVLNRDGEVLFYVGIERDVTEEQEVDKAKTEFVSLASHQLKTPLSAINWYTELLLSDDTDTLTDEQKEFVQEVAKGSKRMVDLVTSLLNVSRLELGTFVIEPEHTHLKPIINSVLEEVKPLIQKKQLVVTSDLEELEEMLVDPGLMRIIIQNLLTNAVKYTAEKGEISVRLQSVQEKQVFGGKKVKDDGIVVSVTDNGLGIPQHQQDNIFEKLFRADNVVENDTDGTGLGLYMVKSILEETGGDIWFESKENEGSTFYVWLPSSGMIAKTGTKTLQEIAAR